MKILELSKVVSQSLPKHLQNGCCKPLAHQLVFGSESHIAIVILCLRIFASHFSHTDQRFTGYGWRFFRILASLKLMDAIETDDMVDLR